MEVSGDPVVAWSRMERNETPTPRVLSDAIFDRMEASPMPPIVDGAPVPPPPATLKVLRDEDWVCLRGPCRHYHRFEHRLDAMEPRDSLGGPVATHYDDGTPIKPFHAVNHYCYASPGHEMDMTDEVITACNRWDPEDAEHDIETMARNERRRRWAQREAEHAGVMPLRRSDADLEAELARAGLPSPLPLPSPASVTHGPSPFRPDGSLGVRCDRCGAFREPPKIPAPGTEDAYCWNRDHDPPDPDLEEADTAVETPVAKQRQPHRPKK